MCSLDTDCDDEGNCNSFVKLSYSWYSGYKSQWTSYSNYAIATEGVMPKTIVILLVDGFVLLSIIILLKYS